MSDNPYCLSIQTDTGTTLFSQSSGMPTISGQTFSLMQVFCQTSEEMNGVPQVITTDEGLIAFTSLTFANDNQLLIFLSIKKIPTTSETCIQWSQKILYQIRNLLIFHIGIKDFEEDLSKNIFDRLKKQLKILSPHITAIFGGGAPSSISRQGHSHPFAMKFEFLFSSIQVTSHSNRNDKILGLMQKIKEKYNIEHMALWLQDKIYTCTKGWNNMHEADKILLRLYKQVYNDSILIDIPLYFTHTSLLEDMTQLGKMPYRFVILQLSELFTMTLVSDPFIEINDLYDFVKLNVNKEMSSELQKKYNMDSVIDLETPAFCTYWVLQDSKDHVLRSYAYKNEYHKYEPIALTLYLQMPVVKDQVQYQQLNQIQGTDNDIAFQQYIFVKENNMQLFRIKDKGNLELVMLFEKEINSNLVVKNFFRKLMEIIEKQGSKQDYVL